MDYELKEKLCEYLIRRITDCISGSGEEGAICLFEKPSYTYFAGSLKPIPRDINDEELISDLRSGSYSRETPFAMGVLCLLSGQNSDAVLKITPRLSFYYRVIPDYEQQKKVPGKEKPVPVFKRIRREFNPIRIRLDDLIKVKKIIIRSETHPDIKREMEEIKALIKNDRKVYRKDPAERITPNIDETEFNRIIAEALRGEIPYPDWQFEILCEISDYGDKKLVQILLVNTSGEGDDIRETFIFDVSLTVEPEGDEIFPFEFIGLPGGYRFDNKMWGLGINCVTEPIRIDRPECGLKTVYIPVYRQKRYGTRTMLPNGKPITELKFDSLIRDPIRILKNLLKDMEEYKRYWKDLRHRYSGNDLKDFEEDLKNFEKEIERFERGIELLENPKYSILRQAFVLMNEAFAKQARLGFKNYTEWRPFQIVFIVSHLKDMAAQHWIEDFSGDNDLEKVSVLWFPTGGGKTEAYFGLTVCNLFFDRLRGKTSGVTALYRFPLRLLTLQQFQRLAGIIAAAEIVRREKGIEGGEFSLGFWAGNDQTPNEVRKNDVEELERLPQDELNERYRKLRNCPFCGATVNVRFDRNSWRLMHVCENQDCTYGRNGLPLYIVDNEIYRYLPSVIVSTIDKIATLGYQVRFANILGMVKSYCVRGHGYSWNDKCEVCEFYHGVESDTEKVDEQTRKLMRPTLQIQDELHLLKEELGAFDSHYETFIIRLQRELSGGLAWKNIASTATIRRFDYHVEHLYCRNVKTPGEHVRFPVPGPTWEESFYSSSDKRIGRYFVGVMPHNKTHINATVEILWYFHREIQNLRKLSGEEFSRRLELEVTLTDTEKDRLLDDYEVSLTYVLTKRDGDQVAESISSQVNSYLKKDGLNEVRNEMLTGSTSGDRVTAILDEVLKGYKFQDHENRIRSITATSMISHGVDVDRFNFMVFFGMPRQTAEYIQASSRIARTSPGISILCFAPGRERDRTHYWYFKKFHEYMERLVEPPAINRWSKFSIDKTLPGLFTGLLFGKYSRELGYSLWRTGWIKKAIERIDENDVKTFLKEAYVADREPTGEFGSLIENYVHERFEELKYDYLRFKDYVDNLKPEPMTSLRDTEEPIGFFPEEQIKDDIEKIIKR